MGRQPGVLIVARHGQRLDQSDKEWQDKSDQPWDSPLSYGGWIQCQNLGARIATELQNLDHPVSSSDGGRRESTAAGTYPRKRRKITIHSSPYLRCIQTSIGIAAGLRYPQDVLRVRPIPAPLQRSSLSLPPMSHDDEATSLQLPKTTPAAREPSPARPENVLPELKIDAWLGEWLSSGYFDKSKPPPSSDTLVKTAKEGLRKPPEEIKGADVAAPVYESDGSNLVESPKEVKEIKNIPMHEKTGLRAMAAKGHSMPRRTRTVSLSTNQNGHVSTPSSEPTRRRPRSTTYSPPIPTYSIAPKDTIPIGFVAHARDACVDTDFEWDSEKEPLEWGDGGQYKEEWSTMHRRFRNGLTSLLAYYANEEADEMDVDDLEAEEDVVILVTHQAGCNALIRLLTGAPALHDVGTASLTLAVRKPELTRVESSKSTSPDTARRGSLDLGLNKDFDMKIIASTEHLRQGSNPLGLNSPRLSMSPAFTGRRMVGAESLEGFSIGDPLSWRSASQTAIGRSSHAGSMNFDTIGQNGLWSMSAARSSSISSDTGIDPRSAPAAPSSNNPKTGFNNISTSVILEDEAIEDWAASRTHHDSHIIQSPMEIDDQTIWQANGTIGVRRTPVRSNSTRLLHNPTAGTGLWGSPISNPGGVKEGTPHSRGSFGMSDTATPMWGARANSKRVPP